MSFYQSSNDFYNVNIKEGIPPLALPHGVSAVIGSIADSSVRLEATKESLRLKATLPGESSEHIFHFRSSDTTQAENLEAFIYQIRSNQFGKL